MPHVYSPSNSCRISNSISPRTPFSVNSVVERFRRTSVPFRKKTAFSTTISLPSRSANVQERRGRFGLERSKLLIRVICAATGLSEVVSSSRDARRKRRLLSRALTVAISDNIAVKLMTSLYVQTFLPARRVVQTLFSRERGLFTRLRTTHNIRSLIPRRSTHYAGRSVWQRLSDFLVLDRAPPP